MMLAFSMSSRLCGRCVSASLFISQSKQTACHLSHEANVEQVFSRAGLLSDPNIDPEFLARMVMLAVNKKWFKPSVQAIKDKYYEMFRGEGGAVSEDQLVDSSETQECV